MSRGRWKSTNVRCGCRCPAGHACTLDTDPRHELHICADEHCYCHSQARYDPPPPAPHVLVLSISRAA